jgi:hypothetical protein
MSFAMAGAGAVLQEPWAATSSDSSSDTAATSSDTSSVKTARRETNFCSVPNVCFKFHTYFELGISRYTQFEFVPITSSVEKARQETNILEAVSLVMKWSGKDSKESSDDLILIRCSPA